MWKLYVYEKQQYLTRMKNISKYLKLDMLAGSDPCELALNKTLFNCLD